MRKIIAGLFISLDGVVETPNKWTSPYFNEEMLEVMGVGTAQADAVLLGRRTYLQFAEYWPSQGSDVPMAAFLNNAPKHVASATLDRLAWANSSLIAGDLAGELTKLKQQPGKNIQLPGSPTLVRSLLRDGLLDELNLFIFPIVVGAGMRLFDEMADQVPLTLVQSKTFSTGVLSVTYQPAS
ncbi:MAG: dihydrofolate reductase family protein [Dehalococcoidia bacterium]